MTSKDLRALMSTELDTLAPMPDLVPQVVRQGATVVRRRRLAAGGLVAAAAIGGVAIAPWANGRGGGSDQSAADSTPTATPSAVPTPAALGGSLVLSDPEVMAAFDAALPERFAPVQVQKDSSYLPAPLVTSADGTEMRIRVELMDPRLAALERCAEQAAAGRSCSEYGDDGDSASGIQLEGGGSHTVTARLAREPWSAIIRLAAEKAVPLSNAELRDLLAHPDFLAMLDSRTASDLVRPVRAPEPTAPAPTDPLLSDGPETTDPVPATPIPTDPQEPVPTTPDPGSSTTDEPTSVPTYPDEPSPTREPARPPTTTPPAPTESPAAATPTPGDG